MRWILALVTAALVACGGAPPTLRLCVWSEVDQYQPAIRPALVQAAADYSAHGRPVEVVDPGSCRLGDVVVLSPLHHPYDPHAAASHARWLGVMAFYRELQDGTPVVFDACPGANGGRAWVVAAHEIGHALGYSHTEDPHMVMTSPTTCDPDLRNELP